MSILTATEKTNVVFLAIVIVAGIIAVLSPSFIVGVTAQAEPEYNEYQDFL
jgi:hypothetical protein